MLVKPYPNNSAFVPDIDLLSHRLREGFRAYCYTMWQNTNRNDADMCREVPYSEVLCQADGLSVPPMTKPF